ncbi:hypothetical protein [Lederbergia ruris]|uniref:hypothetical protein n=1 Tax=Lederbergia ruris TaxID=217495 RepID=UPI00399FE7A7
MKKSFIFVGVFSLAFVAIQVLSGWLLTIMYTPDPSWDQVPVTSYVKFGSTSLLSPLAISIIALAIAAGVTKLINKKTVQ